MDERIKAACPLTSFLLRRVVEPSSPLDSHDNRTRLGMLEGWVSSLINLVLCIVKGWLGIVSGSMALVADATNNLTDMGSSLVVVFGFQWSRKPRDEEHPFGHGRIEAVATLVLAIALLVVGVEVGKSGVDRLMVPRAVYAPIWLMAAVGGTLIAKIWLAYFARKLAVLSKSHVLEADAWNHLFDVAASLLVLLALAGSHLGWNRLDGWMALAVAVCIFWTGVKYAREAIDILLGKKPDEAEVNAVHETVDAVEGVMGVHEIIVHQYGDVKMVSFHIEVAAALSVMEAHRIAEAAEDAVESKLQWRAVAHMDPVDRSHPLFEEMHEMLVQHVEGDAELMDFHDLRSEGATPPYRVSFDLVTAFQVDRDHYKNLCDRVVASIRDRFNGRVSSLEIGIEAPVDSAPMMRRTIDL